ncbi:hypothetical protein D3C76_1349830 [compost metagenome]
MLSESTAVAAMAKRSVPLLVLIMVTDLARRRMAWSMSACRLLLSFIARPSRCAWSAMNSCNDVHTQHRPRGLVVSVYSRMVRLRDVRAPVHCLNAAVEASAAPAARAPRRTG